MDEQKPSDKEPELDITPEQVRMAFASAESKALEAQELHIQSAQHAGYTREAIHVVTPFYVHLAEIAQDIPELRPFITTGVQVINALESELNESVNKAKPLPTGLYDISASANAFINTAGTAEITIGSGMTEGLSFESPPFFSPDESLIENRLSAIDHSLADTYNEIGQAYHGTTADPARAAIALMRQTFDHFFSELAPDDAVRASPYWESKSGEKPNQITRRERITYVARTHISDQNRANTIIANADNILETYQILNKVHKRGKLSEVQARSALKTMKSFIETVTEAIEGS